MKELCPLCDTGSLVEAFVTEELRYRDTILTVPGIAISVCDSCAEEVIQPHQIRANERAFADAKRTFDGLLVSRAIVQLREALGITQQQACSMFGGGPNAFSKYERGEVIQSRAMDLLLRVSARFPEAAQYLSERAGVEIARDRWEASPANEQQILKVESAVSHVVKSRVHHITLERCANDGWQQESSELAYG